MEAPLEDLFRFNDYICVRNMSIQDKLLTFTNWFKVVIEEISHDDKMSELRNQDDISRQAAASVVCELLEWAEPEDQLEDSGEAQREDRVANKSLLDKSNCCYEARHKNIERGCIKLILITWCTSTVPALSPACLWNMYICGNIATASKYIDRVHAVSDTHSLFNDLGIAKVSSQYALILASSICNDIVTILKIEMNVCTHGWQTMARRTHGPTK